MPFGFLTTLAHLISRFFRLPRFFFGRIHRRKPTRGVQQADRSRLPPEWRDQWWSDEPRWFPGSYPPRRHNELTPLIDGEAHFGTMLDAIRAAQHYVYVVGWALTPAFALERPERPGEQGGTLGSALADIAERIPVKLLIWGGASILFQPSRHFTRRACEELRRQAPAIDVRLDDHFRPTHSHHQKAVIVDGQVAFVGGLDLTTLEADRWDRPGHPLRYGRNWHDVALQVLGEAVAALQANFLQRWEEVTGECDLPRREPQVEPGWETPCQVVRTIPRRTYRFAPRGEFGIAHAYLAAIERASRFVYLESQYLWSAELVDALTAAMDRDTSGRFRVVVVLPARADMGKYDNDKHIEELQEADGGKGRFAAYSLYTGGPASGIHGFHYRSVYVHAKVAIVDDEWYTVGSANLNHRGLATDTEMNVQAIDPAGARALRHRLWSEHLGLPVEEVAAADPLYLIDHVWPQRAAEVSKIVERRWGYLPALVHPYDADRRPGTWLLQEIEGLFEGL